MSTKAKKKDRRYEVSLRTRDFEIELFWKRSYFFWLFVAACFAAYASLGDKQPVLAIVVANVGMVTSFGWSLANRGSKYWQENWETKVANTEDRITGPLFTRPGRPLPKGCWLSARMYSVSKIAIALSDFICGATPVQNRLLNYEVELQVGTIWLKKDP